MKKLETLFDVLLAVGKACIWLSVLIAIDKESWTKAVACLLVLLIFEVQQKNRVAVNLNTTISKEPTHDRP